MRLLAQPPYWFEQKQLAKEDSRARNANLTAALTASAWQSRPP